MYKNYLYKYYYILNAYIQAENIKLLFYINIKSLILYLLLQALF